MVYDLLCLQPLWQTKLEGFRLAGTLKALRARSRSEAWHQLRPQLAVLQDNSVQVYSRRRSSVAGLRRAR